MHDSLEKHGVGIVHHFSSGVYAKETHIPAGIVLTQHSHGFDHMAILASGQVAVEVDGLMSIQDGPSVITIKAGKMHKVQAIIDSVWYCIHSVDETNPDHVDQAILSKVGE